MMLYLGFVNQLQVLGNVVFDDACVALNPNPLEAFACEAKKGLHTESGRRGKLSVSNRFGRDSQQFEIGKMSRDGTL